MGGGRRGEGEGLGEGGSGIYRGTFVETCVCLQIFVVT